MTSAETQVQTCDCAAHHCPLYGTSTRSTSGTTEWYCFIHFGAEARDWPHISAELNRLGWLVDIVRGLRKLAYTKVVPPGFMEEARKAIALCQRSDLQPRETETTVGWMIRLEGVLAQSCKDSIVPKGAW
jgi:hypothetical protein